VPHPGPPRRLWFDAVGLLLWSRGRIAKLAVAGIATLIDVHVSHANRAHRCTRIEREEKCYGRSVRIKVVGVHECWSEKPTFRLCEQNGGVCDCWLPGLEPPDWEGPLDRGGFEQRLDAQAFALGVDYERALFGLLDVTIEDVDRERAQLDDVRTINGANRKLRQAVIAAPLEQTDDAPQLDLEALLEAVSEPAAPVVTHRRRVA
jgi:hypothetical protein